MGQTLTGAATQLSFKRRQGEAGGSVGIANPQHNVQLVWALGPA